MRKGLIAAQFFLFFLQINAQDHHKIDSLLNLYNNAKDDSLKIQIYLDIGGYYDYTIPDSAIFYYEKAKALAIRNINDKKTGSTFQKLQARSLAYIAIAYLIDCEYDKSILSFEKSIEIYEKIDEKIQVAKCYNNIGVAYKAMGNYDLAIESYSRSLQIYKDMDDNIRIAETNNNLGNVLFESGNYDKAIEYYLSAVKSFEKIDNKNGIGRAYNNIGLVHKKQVNLSKSEEYCLKALTIFEEGGDVREIANCYNNLGNIYNTQEKYDESIETFSKAIKSLEDVNDKKLLADLYNNIGLAYSNINNLNLAISSYLKSLDLYRELNSINSMARVYSNIAGLEIQKAENKTKSGSTEYKSHLISAIEYGKLSLSLLKESRSIPVENETAYRLQKAYTLLGKYKEALDFAELYIATKDSMFSEDKTKALAEMSAKYESEKKQLEIEKMHKQKALDNKTIEAQQAENRKQFVIIVSSVLGFIIVLIFSVILLRMFAQKRKANILLSEQKAEIEEKNRDIMDSITYAKRIQTAILPPQKIVKEYLKDSFILYKPKDIVAGDFYWMEHKDGKILFAAADCTGHGVPGAMVSVVCNNGLNRSVREHGLTDPGKILDKTREIVIQEFEKSEEEVKDGMDIALCSLDGNILKYAGAHNPLWIIRDNEIIEIKADKQPIGVSLKQTSFSTQTIELVKGDSIYIFSDGYVDQFGGESGKKFKSKAFKELLLSIQNNTMEEQRIILDENFERWRGKLEQIDDVCVIGVKL